MRCVVSDWSGDAAATEAEGGGEMVEHGGRMCRLHDCCIDRGQRQAGKVQFENERVVVVLIVSAASCGFVPGTSAEMAELPLAVSAGIIESVSHSRSVDM